MNFNCWIPLKLLAFASYMKTSWLPLFDCCNKEFITIIYVLFCLKVKVLSLVFIFIFFVRRLFKKSSFILFSIILRFLELIGALPNLIISHLNHFLLQFYSIIRYKIAICITKALCWVLYSKNLNCLNFDFTKYGYNWFMKNFKATRKVFHWRVWTNRNYKWDTCSRV